LPANNNNRPDNTTIYKVPYNAAGVTMGPFSYSHTYHMKNLPSADLGFWLFLLITL